MSRTGFASTDRDIELWKSHLDATGSWGTRIDILVTRFLLVHICGRYETAVGDAIRRRAARSGDAPLAAYVDKSPRPHRQMMSGDPRPARLAFPWPRDGTLRLPVRRARAPCARGNPMHGCSRSHATCQCQAHPNILERDSGAQGRDRRRAVAERGAVAQGGGWAGTTTACRPQTARCASRRPAPSAPPPDPACSQPAGPEHAQAVARRDASHQACGAAPAPWPAPPAPPPPPRAPTRTAAAAAARAARADFSADLAALPAMRAAASAALPSPVAP